MTKINDKRNFSNQLALQNSTWPEMKVPFSPSFSCSASSASRRSAVEMSRLEILPRHRCRERIAQKELQSGFVSALGPAPTSKSLPQGSCCASPVAWLELLLRPEAKRECSQVARLAALP